MRRPPLKRSSHALRHSKPLGRGDAQLRRASALRRTARKRRPALPTEVRQLVAARTGGLCACGCGALGAEAHHVFPVRLYPGLVLEPDNMVWVAPACHARHENAHRRLPRRVVRFAERLAVTPAMRAFLDRTYGPGRGSPERASGRG